MKILVTGTSGFIGYHLARKLLERGDTVVGIDNINELPLTPKGESQLTIIRQKGTKNIKQNLR